MHDLFGEMLLNVDPNKQIARFGTCRLEMKINDLKKTYSLRKFHCILIPRGRAPFGQQQESRPLAMSNDILVLNGFVTTID